MHTPDQVYPPATMPTLVILAAGAGQRMLPLTQATPKPLLQIAGISLLDRHLASLNRAFSAEQPFRLIINIAHLGQQIIDAVNHASYPNLDIRFSDERATGALETAGALVKMLPLIKTEHILVINADTFTDLAFDQFWQRARVALQTKQAYLGLVPNPEHHPLGDFCLAPTGDLQNRHEATQPTFTFSGIGAYCKSLFAGLDEGVRPLAPLLKTAIDQGLVAGELLNAEWHDIGTPERLNAINQLAEQN